MPKEKKKPHYLCVNADESEPGTFKDREIMRWTPHALLEGAAIAAHAIQAEVVYIYIRGEFTEPWAVMEKALAEATAAGVFGATKLYLHRGAGAYICGEETALMNSIEGKRGNPRIKPPFPAAAGVFGMPTTINNVETLAAVPLILKKGAAWYKGLSLSSPKSTGTKLFSVCGHVQKPGNYEVTMGFPLKDLLYDLCGGMPPGRTLKACIPGGSSVPILNREDDLCAVGFLRRPSGVRNQEVQEGIRRLYRGAPEARHGRLMADELVNLTIDGVPVSVPKGMLVIEAAKQAGVLVPHYCYHPGLPVAGVCRMCLVDIEKAPKLQIACATQVAEGMVVRTQSPQAKSGRMGVLELLLINHPLDCPICDQAGECELQDFTFQEGRPATRYSPDYAKRFNPVEDFGPDVLYVPNRCILCTLSVRFREDVAKEQVLNVSERGDRAYIGIHSEGRLDHPWAGNVVDLCPVGSLLSKDFLHKARAWELDKAASICTGCSQGCNVTLDTRENVVVRVRPRPNLDVNRYFICDHGRMNYRWMNRGDRIEAPLVRRDGELRATDWDEALDVVASRLRGAGGTAVALVSPRVSTEALFFARELFRGHEWSGAFQVVMGEEAPLAGVPNLALRAERAPNGRGAELLGYRRDYASALAAAETAAVVLVLDEPDIAVRTAGKLVYVGTGLPERARDAEGGLPIADVAEEEGTFVNRDGRVQRYLQAKPAPGMARPAWWVFAELVATLQGGGHVATAADAFDRLAASVDAFRGLSYPQLGFAGAP